METFPHQSDAKVHSCAFCDVVNKRQKIEAAKQEFATTVKELIARYNGAHKA